MLPRIIIVLALLAAFLYASSRPLEMRRRMRRRRTMAVLEESVHVELGTDDVAGPAIYAPVTD